MKKFIIGLVALVIVLMVIGRISNNEASLPPKSFMDSITNSEVTVPPVENTGWEYYNDSDKMDGSKRYFAVINSTNKLYFHSPYDGGSTGTLTVRKKNGKNEIYLTVSKGQFLDNISEDRYIRLKFDDSKPISILYDGTSDYSSTIIFLRSPSTIISKLKNAKHLLLDIEFYEEGRQVFDFDVSNLEWKH